MAKRRLLWCAVSVLLVVVLVPSWPYTYYGVRGLLNREPFYKGLPASYWSNRLAPRDWFRDHVSGTLRRVGLADERSPLREDDPAAVPVLLALTADPRSTVRARSLSLLVDNSATGGNVLRAVAERLEDDDEVARRHAAVVLVTKCPSQEVVAILLRLVARGRPDRAAEAFGLLRWLAERDGAGDLGPKVIILARDEQFLRHATGPDVVRRLGLDAAALGP